MARRVIIEVDAREQEPLLFPDHLVWAREPYRREIIRLETVRRELPYGDYRLARYPRKGVIERKAGLDELAHNLLTADRERFHRAWARFVTGCEHPILLLEGSFALDKLHAPTKCMTSEDVRSAVCRLMLEVPRLIVLWSGRHRSVAARTRLGAEAVRLLLTCTQT